MRKNRTESNAGIRGLLDFFSVIPPVGLCPGAPGSCVLASRPWYHNVNIIRSHFPKKNSTMSLKHIAQPSNLIFWVCCSRARLRSTLLMTISLRAVTFATWWCSTRFRDIWYIVCESLKRRPATLIDWNGTQSFASCPCSICPASPFSRTATRAEFLRLSISLIELPLLWLSGRYNPTTRLKCRTLALKEDIL